MRVCMIVYDMFVFLSLLMGFFRGGAGRTIKVVVYTAFQVVRL